MNDWQPIETAPRDGTSILLWTASGPVIGWWETGREFLNSPHFNDWSKGMLGEGTGHDMGFDRVYAPTHWLPLPAPPKA